MTDEMLELLKGSGLLTIAGRFNQLGQHFLDDLLELLNKTGPTAPERLAEVLAQYITMPAPLESELATTNVGYNLNFNFSAADLTNVTDGDIDRMADCAKQFLNRLAED